MNIDSIIFMVGTWLFVIALNIYCFVKIFQHNDKKTNQTPNS